jgi:hypothetical protein
VPVWPVPVAGAVAGGSVVVVVVPDGSVVVVVVAGCSVVVVVAGCSVVAGATASCGAVPPNQPAYMPMITSTITATITPIMVFLFMVCPSNSLTVMI